MRRAEPSCPPRARVAIPPAARVAIAACLAAACAGADHALPSAAEIARLPSDGGERFNRLVHSRSPYLLQHARNPVDWYPWGEEAFAKARAEDKPIFLSIGYSSCHWCHVMERESFADPAIAAVINRDFVPVKVDREERPDVDRIYMAYVQSHTGQGGWPLTVWLTPQLKPFAGVTYLPPADRDGMPGLPNVLAQVTAAWRDRRPDIETHGEAAVASLRAPATPAPSAADAGDPLRQAHAVFAASFVEADAGFGEPPRFPQPSIPSFLLRCASAAGAPADQQKARDMAYALLRRMAAGGIHDQLGGGFHRYAVDGGWLVPHFEKMLYDQAGLAVAYLDAYQASDDPAFAAVARDVLDYVTRELRDPAGGFHAGEDADSRAADGETREGAYYAWSRAGIAAALEGAVGDGQAAHALAAVLFHHGVTDEGNVPAALDHRGELRGLNVLAARRSVAETAAHLGLDETATRTLLARARAALLAARATRARPHRDDKVLVGWNGLTIAALARAGLVLGEDRYLDHASAAADFIWEHCRTADGRLVRSWRGEAGTVPGFCEDYAAFIHGLLALYDAMPDPRWLARAVDLQRRQEALFLDTVGGGYFDAAAGDPSLLVRTKEDQDGPIPAPASLTAGNLLRLEQLCRLPSMRAAAGVAADEDYAGRAARAIQATGIASAPYAWPMLLVAEDLRRRELHVTLVGPADGTAADDEVLEWWRALHRPFHPRLVAVRLETGREPGMIALGGKPTAYICSGTTCFPPTTDLAKALELLGRD